MIHRHACFLVTRLEGFGVVYSAEANLLSATAFSCLERQSLKNDGTQLRDLKAHMVKQKN